MPTPGSGFGGGSVGGGGFGGGGGHRGRGYYYRPYGFGFWGFGGGLFSIFLMPFMFIFFAVIILLSTILGAVGGIAEGGITDYEEKRFQEYALTEYQKAFAESSMEGYEDNILLVFLTNEQADGYYCISVVGNDINDNIYKLFINENAKLNTVVAENINQSGYWYSLDKNLALTVNAMSKAVTDDMESEHLSSAFTCEEEHNKSSSKLINYGGYTLNEKVVNSALQNFTAETGITMSIVVNDMDEVFGVDYTSMIMSIIIAVVLIALSVFFIVKGVRARRRAKRGYNPDNPFV